MKAKVSGLMTKRARVVQLKVTCSLKSSLDTRLGLKILFEMMSSKSSGPVSILKLLEMEGLKGRLKEGSFGYYSSKAL